MNEKYIAEMFITKNGKLNNNYKNIISKLDESVINYINTLYPLYDDVNDKLKSVINNSYRKCPVCENVMSWQAKNKTCSKECAKISLNINQTKTNMERYGVTNPAKNKEFVEKMKKTNLDRYGVSLPLKNKEFVEKMKKTNLDRYGTDHHMKTSNSKDRIKNITNQKKVDFLYENTGIQIDIDKVDLIHIDFNRSYNKGYLVSLIEYVLNGDKPSKEEILNEFSLTSSKYKYLNLYGYENDTNKSLYESELCSFLDYLGIEYETSNRTLISPYELDIYIPDYNLAIEFNGSYWHSDKFKDKYYHQNKTKLCNEQGITLIHIHEHLYKSHSFIYKNIIKSKLNLNERVFARKCLLKEIDVKEERDFLNKYHLQGYVASKFCYGLYNTDNELLTLCSFGQSRFDKKYKYELLRNCTKEGITVVGGLSKLIKHFKKEIFDDKILCYSDASISYNKSNEITKPNYVWIKGNLVLKRYQTQKQRLNKLLGDSFNECKTEDENMKENGFVKLYDSGNYITLL